MPWNSATSVPQQRRCRSASSQVSVRRESITTMRISGRAALAGFQATEQDRWAKAMLLPAISTQSAQSRSS